MKQFFDSGSGSVGREFASNTRDPQFESRDWQNFIDQLYSRKDKNEEKEAREGPSLKKSSFSLKSLASINLVTLIVICSILI